MVLTILEGMGFAVKQVTVNIACPKLLLLTIKLILPTADHGGVKNAIQI